MGRLSGQVAYVLGGGATGAVAGDGTIPMGNGRAIAMRLASEGARVAVGDHDLDRARMTVDQFDTDGFAVQVDAADPDSCRRALQQVTSAWAAPDLVVTNVGVSGSQPLKVQSLEDWDHAVAVNVTSHWITVQEALGPMLDRGAGRIVFVGSTAGLLSSRRSMSYEATKAALLAIMRHTAVRYGSRGIRANAIVLGNIDSAVVRERFGGDDVAGAGRAGVVPLGRQGTPDEVAATAAFLLSDDASYINGQSIVIDGGVTAAWPQPPPVGTPGSDDEQRGT